MKVKAKKKPVVKKKVPKKVNTPKGANNREFIMDKPKWLLFSKYYFDPKEKATFSNKYKSAVKAGFSKSYASSMCKKKVSENVSNSLAEALEAEGINSEFLAKKIGVLLNAQVKVRTKLKGKLLTEIETEDSFAINAGLKHSVDIRGDKAPDKVDIKSPELVAAIERIVDKLP